MDENEVRQKWKVWTEDVSDAWYFETVQRALLETFKFWVAIDETGAVVVKFSLFDDFDTDIDQAFIVSETLEEIISDSLHDWDERDVHFRRELAKQLISFGERLNASLHTNP